MAYGTMSFNNKTGNVKSISGLTNYYTVTSANIKLVDSLIFTDFIHTSLSGTSSTANAALYGALANGGTITMNDSFDRDLFGDSKCYGVVRISTGTTSNASGYSGFTTATILPGFPTPAASEVTKYEIECLVRTDTTIFTTSLPGRIKIGFASTFTSATPNDGVYFEWNQPASGGDTNWNITFLHDSSSVRVDTGVAFAASKTYQFYLYVNKNSSGNYTTQYRVKNITDSTDTGLQTASPSGGNAAYPSDTADVMQFGGTLTKQTTTVTTPIGILFDYFAAKYQLALTRTYINLFG